MPEHLNFDTFKDKIFDFESNKEWKFKGERPALIDFYASWCAPCKSIAPILEELSKEYAGKVDVYKINTEEERELSQIFGIRSIPTLLFIPMKDNPQVAHGALPRAEIVRLFKEILDVE